MPQLHGAGADPPLAAQRGGLLERIERERRQGERRLQSAAGGLKERRRRPERRVGARDLFDATEFAVEERDEALADGEVTRIHHLV